MKLVELFKECTWEGVEPYLQQFPNWDYGKHKMKGMRRLYDDLQRIEPVASDQRVWFRKPTNPEWLAYSEELTWPVILDETRCRGFRGMALDWDRHLGMDVEPDSLSAAAKVAAYMCVMSEFGYTWQEAKEKHGRRKGDDEEEEVILDEDWSIEIQRLESEQPIDQRLIEKCLWVHSPVSVDEVEPAKQHCVVSIKLSSRTDKSRAERLKKAIALLDGTLAPYERCVVSMDTTPEHPATIEEQQAAETAIREIMPHNPQIKWHFHMEKSIYAGKAMNVRIIASKND